MNDRSPNETPNMPATAIPSVTSENPSNGATSRLWRPPTFDRTLVTKYDASIPRYTSYPPAPAFTDDRGVAAYRDLLAESRASDAPLSLYVHIPFCETRCFFCGCNVDISRNRERAAAYLERLDREIDLVASLLGGTDRRVVQAHWGGGTPTFLPADMLEELGHRLMASFGRDPELEFGVEVDPRRCTPDQLDALVEVGVNRLSFGVQDVEPEVQRAINRIQPIDETLAVVKGARDRGITSLNVDLIYGLPHQTPASFARTVDQVLEALDPDRLAVFNFAYLPEMLPHQRVIDPETLPSPDDKLTILEGMIDQLTAHGYVFIGLDHFAKPEDPLAQALADGTMTRNFQGYSTWGGVDLVGLGCSAIGRVAGGFAQNERATTPYQMRIDQDGLATVRGWKLTAEDDLRNDVILDLMCRFRLDKATIESRYGIDFDQHFATELTRLEPLADDGLIEIADDYLEVTDLGRLLVRNVAATFDAYLSTAQARFSRSV